MEIFYVYILSSNGVPFYVGKGKKTENYDRINYHIKYWEHNKNKKLKNKIKKLNGIFNINIIFESINEQKCLDIETQLIKEIGKETLCNLTNGGEGISGWKHSKESKQKISIWRAGISLSKETCEKITQNKMGNNYKLKNIPEGKIEELYENYSIQNIANKLNLSFYTVKKYLVKNNIYKPSKNKKVSEETKCKMSYIMLGKNNKPVIQYDKQMNILNEFKSISEACNYINKPNRQADITTCCKGKQKTAFGFIWKYKEN